MALRGLFIINPEGILRQITVNDLPVGRSIDEVLRLVKAFQFTDQHGEGMLFVDVHIYHYITNNLKTSAIQHEQTVMDFPL